MQLTSVNIGEKRTLQKGEELVTTGIFKFPASGRVRVTELGLEGDVVMDKKHHGGPDQAVYVYGGADYAWWRDQLGRDLPPGLFGENLTISELESAAFNIGDVLIVGEVKLQVTAPRIPCSDFAARMEDLQWVKKFRAAERPGLYCRVLQEGCVQAGGPVSVERYAGETLSIVQMYRDYYEPKKDEALIQRHLNAPIDIRTRRKMEALQLQSKAEQQNHVDEVTHAATSPLPHARIFPRGARRARPDGRIPGSPALSAQRLHRLDSTREAGCYAAEAIESDAG